MWRAAAVSEVLGCVRTRDFLENVRVLLVTCNDRLY